MSPDLTETVFGTARKIKMLIERWLEQVGKFSTSVVDIAGHGTGPQVLDGVVVGR